MNNAFFGMTMENVGQHMNLEFVSHSKIQQILNR